MRSKLSILALALMGYGFSASAAPLTPGEALQRAKGSNNKKLAAAIVQQSKPAYTFETVKGTPAVYVFNQEAKDGYILLSADDAATPVLGYADNGVFDAENMSPEMKWWLGEYARQIAYAQENNIEPAAAEAQSDFKAIAPMVTSRWNQDAPYNLQCPTDPSTKKQCVTGCVATAMAQVMNYWKYPEVGTGTISYRPSGFTTSLTLDLSKQKFDWANMLNRYSSGNYNSTQSAAVAYLMKACGYSVNMGYSSNASGAQSYTVGKALMDYFGYNRNISYLQRDYYTISEWNQIVYNELSAGRPVLYAGQSDGGGHEFVCDGYSEGFFHINWGWGGMSDGYFKLDALNPGSEGIGGGSGGFNYSQDIMVGVQPTLTGAISSNLLLQGGTLTATVSSMRITPKLTGASSGVWNWGYSQISVVIGAEISPVDNPSSKTYVSIQQGNVNGRSGYSSVSSFTFPSTLADGKYKCTLVNRNNAVSNSPWIPIRCQVGNSNYIYVTKTGSTLKVENVPVASLTLDEGSISGKLYYQCVSTVNATLSNSSDIELSALIVPVITNANGTALLEGDAMAVSLNPGEKNTFTWKSIFELSSSVTGELSSAFDGILRFRNKLTGTYYDAQTPVTVQVNSSVSPSASNFKITGANREAFNGYNNVWIVTDPENINATFTLTNRAGYFGYPTYLYVVDPETSYILQSSWVDLAGLEANKSVLGKGSMNFATGDENKLYMVGVMYLSPSNTYMLLSQSYMTVKYQSSGVGEAEMESAEPVEYFDLQGRKIENPSKGIYIKRQGAKVEKVIL